MLYKEVKKHPETVKRYFELFGGNTAEAYRCLKSISDGKFHRLPSDMVKGYDNKVKGGVYVQNAVQCILHVVPADIQRTIYDAVVLCCADGTETCSDNTDVNSLLTYLYWVIKK